MTLSLEFYRSPINQQYFWRLRARNGRIVACSGEGYRKAVAACEGAALTCLYGMQPDSVDRYASPAGDRIIRVRDFNSLPGGHDPRRTTVHALRKPRRA